MPLERVVALLYDPASAFEYAVGAEVFGVDRTDDGITPFRFQTAGPATGEPVPFKTGGAIVPSHVWEDAIGADLVILPSAPLCERYDERYLRVLREAYESGATILTICSGAFPLAATGLLDGRCATTHWKYMDDFRAMFPRVEVSLDVLFVDDGRIITGAGTAAGIDACLHLVNRELGAAVSNSIARRMVVPPQRDGGQRQYVDTPIPPCRADSLQPVLAAVMEDLAAPHSVRSLARKATMSERTFARRFAAETGTTPHQWLLAQRVLRARELLERSDLGIEQVAHRVGFSSAAVLRTHFQHVLGTSPQQYRRAFAC